MVVVISNEKLKAKNGICLQIDEAEFLPTSERET